MEIGGIVLCWFLFGASHMALSSLKLRPKRVGVLGDPGVTLAIRWFHSSLFGGARTRSAEPEGAGLRLGVHGDPELWRRRLELRLYC